MIAFVQTYVFLALYLLVFGASVVALIDAARRPARAFVTAGKRTRTFWLAVLGVATAVAFVAIPAPIGIGALSFLALGSAVAAIIYLTDVRPAIAPYSGGGNRRGGGRGSGW